MNKESRLSSFCSFKHGTLSNCSSENYEVNGHNNGASRLTATEVLSSYFIKALNFKKYQLKKAVTKILRADIREIRQVRLSDACTKVGHKLQAAQLYHILDFVLNFKTALDGNGIPEGATMHDF